MGNTQTKIDEIYAQLTEAHQIAVDLIVARHRLHAEEDAIATVGRQSDDVFSAEAELRVQSDPAIDPVHELAILIEQRERIETEKTLLRKRYQMACERFDVLKFQFADKMPRNVWLRCGDQGVKWSGGRTNLRISICDWDKSQLMPSDDSLA